jgi:hypothetical protein
MLPKQLPDFDLGAVRHRDSLIGRDGYAWHGEI